MWGNGVRNCICRQESSFTEPWDCGNLGIVHDRAGKVGASVDHVRSMDFSRYWELMESFW